MTGATLARGWNHTNGNKIQSDGSPPIKYEREDGTYHIVIEGEVNEDDGRLEYRAGMFTTKTANSNKTIVEDGYPRLFPDIDAAFDYASDLMAQYALDADDE